MEEVMSSQEVYRLAKLATAPWRHKALPPSLSREDLEQTAALEILTRAQQAWEAGKQFSSRLLVRAASDALAREVHKAHRGDAGPLPENMEAEATAPEAPEASELDTRLATLSATERKAIALYYGLDGFSPAPQAVVAEKMNLSDSSCARLLDQALGKLATYAGGPPRSSSVMEAATQTLPPVGAETEDFSPAEEESCAPGSTSPQVAPGKPAFFRPKRRCSKSSCRTIPYEPVPSCDLPGGDLPCDG